MARGSNRVGDPLLRCGLFGFGPLPGTWASGSSTAPRRRPAAGSSQPTTSRALSQRRRSPPGRKCYRPAEKGPPAAPGPGSASWEGGRERCQKEESTATTHPELSSRTWWSHCGGHRALFIMTCGSGEARRALRLVYSECEIGLCSLTSASGCPASIRLGLSSLSGRTRAAAATPSSNQWPT